jgi:hypothetical protein
MKHAAPAPKGAWHVGAADHAVDRIPRIASDGDAIGYGPVALGTSSSVRDEFRKLAEKKL